MDILESFYRDYFQYLPKDFDSAYILHANSGEIYCFLAYLAKACLKKDNSTKPLFVATKPYHEDIIKLYFPKENYVYYNMYLTEPRLNNLIDFWEYKEHKFRQIFSSRHFNSVNSNLGSIHYFDAMLKTLGIDRKEVSKPVPKITSKSKNNIIKIAKGLELNLDNFVIVSPEALTTSMLPISFWKNLVRELCKKGYDIFLNVVNNTELNCKKYNLSYTDIFSLASMSKAVISLKSGLSEYLLPSNKKNIILAKKFHWSPILTTKQCLEAYSVMKLPFVDENQVFELNVDLYESECNLINHILELIEKD